jgi:hypothetical protein
MALAIQSGRWFRRKAMSPDVRHFTLFEKRIFISPVMNGGAVPKIDRAALMRRAWAIFRETYNYPQIKFSDIGRGGFAWALRTAWAEAREAARIAAMPSQERVERIETLQALIGRAGYIDHGPTWRATIAAYRDEIRQLQSV